MDSNEKLDIAGYVIKQALNNGADQASVTIKESTSRRVDIREQKIDTLKESNGNTLTINLYVDRRYSSHSTNLFKKEELRKFVEGAVAATRYLSEDEFRYLPDKELYYKGGGSDLLTTDTKLNSIDAKDKIDLARQAESEIYGTDNRIISVTATYSDNISHDIFVTSNGFKGENSGSYAAISASVSVRGQSGRPEDYWAEYNIFFDKLIKSGIGKTALERALRKLDPKKIASGKYTMIVDRLAAPNLFGPLISALYGSSMYQKNSFLIGKKNSMVAGSKLSFWDDPLMISGFGSRHFDSEGLNAVKRDMVEQGILRNYYIGTYYGRKLKMEPTTGTPSNVILKTGDKDLNSLVKSVSKGVLVTGFNGGNCNGSTGDFSYGIEGFMIENGEVIYPVNEMNISGNMNDFWNTLEDMGNDPNPYDTFMTPSMLFEKTDFSGL